MTGIDGISVLTPSYNQREFLLRNLNSVKDQAVDFPVEHIIMDGGSTDGTVEFLRQLSNGPGYKHVRWVSEPDDGQTHALRKALALAKYQVVGWLNVDEFYELGAFSKAASLFERGDSTVVAYGDFNRVTADGTLIRVNHQWPYDWPIGRLVTPTIQNCAAFFDRQRMLDVDAFARSDLQFNMDWQLYVDLIQRPDEAKYIPDVLSNFTMHPMSKTSASYSGFIREIWDMRRALNPAKSDRRIEIERRFHFMRLSFILLRRGDLFDKAFFKLFKQYKYANEYGDAGKTWISRYFPDFPREWK